MKFTLRSILPTAAMMFAIAGAANCATIGYRFDLGAAPTEVSYTLPLNQFNPSLGALTGVTLYFYATESITNFTLTNNAASTSTFDATIGSRVNMNPGNSAVTADRFLTPENLVAFDTQSGSCASFQPFTCSSITLGAGATSGNFGPITVNNTDAVYGFTTGTGVQGLTGVMKSGTSIASYIGVGTFNLTGSTLITTSFTGGGGNIAVNQSTNAAFSGEVDYTYTPSVSTPEPATMGLMGGALIGLVALRKRFGRK